MPIVHMIPVKRGMKPDEVVGRLQGGWQLLGRQAVQKGQSIATPGNPEGQSLEDADVWMLSEPMIPQALVATLVVQVAAEYEVRDELITLSPLESLAQELFGMDLMGLREAIEEAASAQGQNPGEG